MNHLSCHSKRSEESLIKLIGQTAIRLHRCFAPLNSPQDESAVADMAYVFWCVSFHESGT